MERRERISDEQEALRLALKGFQSELWTAMPGIIQSFDPVKITVVVQCAISFTQRLQDGTVTDAKMPELVDVPVVTPRGGGCTMTFPIKPGDECMVVFANRCIDGWWQSGGVQKQIEIRMHDLSDGFAFVGPFSQKTKIANWNTSEVTIRSDDGQAVIALDPTTHDITLTTKTNVNIVTQKDFTVVALGAITMSANSDVTITGATINLNP